MASLPNISIVSEEALLLRFSEQADSALLETISVARRQIELTLGDLLVDSVAAYTTLLLIFDDARIDALQARKAVNRALSQPLERAAQNPGETHQIAVCYDAEFGLDLQALAEAKGLAVDEVVALHTVREYRVYAVGFSPGFPFLGWVDERIACARKATPRTRVPAGSVGIADRQTGLYPSVSPGGWNIIGRTPEPMFDPGGEPMSRVRTGDRVRFVAISRAEYDRRLSGPA